METTRTGKPWNTEGRPQAPFVTIGVRLLWSIQLVPPCLGPLIDFGHSQ